MHFFNYWRGLFCIFGGNAGNRNDFGIGVTVNPNNMGSSLSSMPAGTLISPNNLPAKKTVLRIKPYAVRFKNLAPEMQSGILEYVPELAPVVFMSGLMRPEAFLPGFTFQKYFAEAYMIPELAVQLYHPDLLALYVQPFPRNNQGKIQAFRHLVYLLAFTFRASPLKKNLTHILMKAVFRHASANGRSNRRESEHAVLREVFNIEDVKHTDFIHNLLTELFEERLYEPFMHLFSYGTTSYRSPEQQEYPETRHWYDLPDYKQRVAEMYALDQRLFKGSFFAFMVTHHLPADVKVSIVEMLLKELPDGKKFVFTCLRERYYSSPLIKCLFAINYCNHSDLSDDVYLKLRLFLREQYRPKDVEFSQDYFAMLQMRFCNGPYHIINEHWHLSADLLVTMKRYEDAMNVLIANQEPLEKYDFIKRVEFHRHLIDNHLEAYRNNVRFSPVLVDYNLQYVYRFFGCSDFNSLFENELWQSKTNDDKHFMAHASKMIFMHLSLEDFMAFVSRLSSRSIARMNINALIEMKGNSPQFMEYLSVFAEAWRHQQGRYFYLTARNMEKLQSIPEALELLFFGLTSIDEDMLLEFLNYERSYELLLARKNTLSVVPGSGEIRKDRIPHVMNYTAHSRVSQFPHATELKAKIANSIELLYKKA